VKGQTRVNRRKPPTFVIEGLRLLTVVFLAGLGYQIGTALGFDEPVLGALDGPVLGAVLGSGLGYVLGGVLARTTTTSAELAKSRLNESSAEELLAGGFGTISGVTLGAAVSWPVFFLDHSFLAFPLFAFVCLTTGYVGYLVASSKHDGVLALFGSRSARNQRQSGASVVPRVVDTSVAIDGRILDVVRAGFLHGTMLVPTPVLGELQGLADAADDTRRAKGRRGLEVLEALKREPNIKLEVLDVDVPSVPDVDGKLVRICIDRGVALLTLDTNLAKSASLTGIKVLNLHALALALRPPVTAGEEIVVHLLKAGKEPGQAVGYLDDGSMVVVAQARERLGEDVEVLVDSVVMTANGRLVFGKIAGKGSVVGLARRQPPTA
jgi:uncharacterized protein YacL